MRHASFVIVVLALVSLSRAMGGQSQAQPSVAPAATM
jgi:hypothetical protein